MTQADDKPGGGGGPALIGPTFCHAPSWPPPFDIPLAVVDEPSCGYFPGRPTRLRAFAAAALAPAVFEKFLDAGFRRSGRVIYQPACRGCRACVPIRIDAARFVPTAAQRRCARRNADLVVTIGPPAADDERFDLYRRYQRLRHGDTETDRESFDSHFARSPVQSAEFAYRDAAGRLLAAGLCDLTPRVVSSVYFYYDPEPPAVSRGLGIFGALVEIDFARRTARPWYHLGYHVAGCRAMEYKAGFAPHEHLGPDGTWR